MDLMVRELVRLQKQLDQLQQSVEDLAPVKTGLAVVGDESESGSCAGLSVKGDSIATETIAALTARGVQVAR